MFRMNTSISRHMLNKSVANVIQFMKSGSNNVMAIFTMYVHVHLYNVLLCKNFNPALGLIVTSLLV